MGALPGGWQPPVSERERRRAQSHLSSCEPAPSPARVHIYGLSANAPYGASAAATSASWASIAAADAASVGVPAACVK